MVSGRAILARPGIVGLVWAGRGCSRGVVAARPPEDLRGYGQCYGAIAGLVAVFDPFSREDLGGRCRPLALC